MPPFNIATGVKTSIRELVAMLQEICGTSYSPEYLPASQVFVTDRVGSTESARELLGFTAATDLRQGLRELVEWRADRIREEAS